MNIAFFHSGYGTAWFASWMKSRPEPHAAEMRSLCCCSNMRWSTAALRTMKNDTQKETAEGCLLFAFFGGQQEHHAGICAAGAFPSGLRAPSLRPVLSKKRGHPPSGRRPPMRFKKIAVDVAALFPRAHKKAPQAIQSLRRRGFMGETDELHGG